MPQIPRYQPNQVQTQGFQGRFSASLPNDPRPAAMAGLGNALGGVGKTIGDIVMQEQEAAAQTMLIEAQGKYMEAEKIHLYDQKQGALFKQGEAAVNPDGKGEMSLGMMTQQNLAKSSAGIEETLPPAAAMAFKKWQAGRLQQSLLEVEKHSFHENKKLQDAKFSATLSNIYDQFALNPYNTDVVKQNFATLEEVVNRRALAQGYSPGSEEYKNLMMDAQSKGHAAVINRMVTDNPLKAKEYYTENYTKLNGEDRLKVERVVGPLASDQLGFNKAIEVADLNPGMPIDKQMMLLRKDPVLSKDMRALKAAESELKGINAERKAAMAAEQEEAAKPVYQVIAQIQASGKIAKQSDIPKDVWARLVAVNPKEAEKIQDEFRSERKAAEAEARGRATEAKMDQVINYVRLLQSPQGLKNTNIEKLYVEGKINKQQFVDLAGEQKKVQNPKEFKIQSNLEAAKDVLGKYKVTEKKDPETYYRTLEDVKMWGDAYQQQYGKEPTQQEIESRIKTRFETKVKQPGMLWDSEVPIAKVKPEKIAVPQKYTAPIDKALKANGMPVTAENRSKYYYKWLQQNNFQEAK